jgi:tetratricopeptide (TPR) repeat protein
LAHNGAHQVQYSHLVGDLLRLLPEDQAARLDSLSRDPGVDPEHVMRAVLEAFPAGDPVVVLLDNLESVMDAETETLSEPALGLALKTIFAAPAHAVTVIATTRVVPAGLVRAAPAGHRLRRLDEGLTAEDAAVVLRELDDERRLGLADAPAEVLAGLWEHTRGFPRALEAIKAILEGDPALTPLDLIDRTRNLPEDQVVEILVGQALDLLDRPARQVMQALAVFPAPVSPVGVDFLLQPVNPTINAAPILSRLVRRQLARVDWGQFHMHPVDRGYALDTIPKGELEDPGTVFTLAGLRARAAEYYAQIRKPPATWRALDDLGPQLAEFDLRCEAGDYDTAHSVLTDISSNYLQQWGHIRLVAGLHERLTGRLADPSDIGANHANLGNCCFALGQTQTAIEHYQRTLAITREIGDRRGEATALGNLGNCFADLGQTQTGIEHYEQALAIDRESGDRQGEAIHLGNLGLCYADLGQTQTAMEHDQQALAIAREVGYRKGEAADLGNLGLCYAALGQTEIAIEHHQQALAAAREIGYRQGEATHLGNLGSCYAALGQTEIAMEHHQQALAAAREIGYRQGEATHLGNLGNRYAALGQTEIAIARYQEALAIVREIGYRQGEAIHLGNLGLCYAALGQTRTAIQHDQQGLAIARGIGYLYGEAMNLVNLGDLAVDRDELEAAGEFYHEAVGIGEQTGNAQVQSEARVGLSICSLLADDLDRCRLNAEQARAVDYPDNRAKVVVLIGITCLREDQAGPAEAAFAQAVMHADARLLRTGEDYTHLDSRGLALCGLALADHRTAQSTGQPPAHPDALADATESFRHARRITTAAGITARTLRLLDQLTLTDPDHFLHRPRAAAAGQPRQQP